MRKAVRSILLGAVAVLAAMPALSVLLAAAPAHADLDAFAYAEWQTEYALDLDADGRAVAEVTETLVPVFPQHDQNRGIVRALPLTYEDAPAGPEDIRVTDEHGDPVPFSVEEDDRFRAILVGDDSFVHGAQTYVIRYTLHDIVLAADDTDVDEFYWDVLPLERQQPVDEFSLAVTFSEQLAAHLTGNAACYQGTSGSTQPCEIRRAERTTGEPATIEVGPLAVPAGSGVTVAVALDPGTVTQPPERIPNFAVDTLPLLTAGGATATSIAGVVAISALKRKRRRHRGTIIAQYDVPDYLPPLIAAPILGNAKHVIPAEFVHLAVRGALRIEDGEKSRGFFSEKSLPTLQLLDPAAAKDPLDHRTIGELFSGGAPGTRFELPTKDEAFASRMQALSAEAGKDATTRGYFTKERSRVALVLGLVTLGLILLSLPLIFWGIGRPSSLGPLALILAAVGLLFAIAGLVKHRVHTPAGAETREYLLGVELFITVAEADRIRTLQSYTGAERIEDAGINVVQLYERLLPYAMLFGQEKEWGKVLEVAYSQSGIVAPVWYPGLAAGGLAKLDTSLSRFTDQLTSSAGYSSSSSGGSSGGGFSGGGGGGGFSGGR